MANMNFGVNILPSTDNTYTLGNSDKKWIIHANSLNGVTVPATPVFTDTWRPVSDAIDSESSSDAASSKAVKTAYDLAASKTSLTLGETSTTAYRGDRGKTAYNHSQSTHAPTTSKDAVSGGTDLSLVTTGEKYTWNNKTSNVGTITGITMNGASKGTSGVVDLGTVITSHQSLANYAPKASPALTGTPTAPTATAGTNNTQIATTAFVMNAFQANDAMVFKGTIGSSGATVTSLPATHYQGWTYKVLTAGTYAGQACEIGDMIICVTDGTSATDSHWTVVQSNIDGVVIGPASSTDAHIATFDGATGKLIKDSGYTIAKSVPSDAKFTDTTYSSKTAASGGTDVSLVTTGEKYTWNNKSNLTIGSTSTTAAAGNHTHGLSLATDSGTSSIVLAANTKYKLTAGGSTYVFTTPPDNNTTYSSKSAASGGTDVSLVTTGEKYTWNSKTSNTGTVTSVATGVGLTGGSITTSGTVKAKLRSETALTNDSSAATETSGRVYPVAVDKSGYLAVNVPWTDHTYTIPTKVSDLTNDSGFTSNTGTITGIKMNGSSKGTSGVVDLGTVLTSHQTIKQDGVTGATVNRFGTCSTAAGTALKTVNITSGTFTLEAGAIVVVSFTNANTANNPSLQVGSNSAKDIFNNGAKITSGSNKGLLKGSVLFIYDGTQYHLIGNYVNTVYSSKTAESGGTAESLVTTGEKYTWNNKSDLALGSTASTAAAGNHTHNLSIATDSGTSSITLSANTKYKITAGGSTYVFTTPADTNTTYSSKTAASDGTEVSLVTTGEKYIWNNKTSNTGTVTSVVAGTGLSGGTITTSGTLSVSYGTSAGTACQGNDSRLSDSRNAKDVYAWAKASTKPSYTYSEVGAMKAPLIITTSNTSASDALTHGTAATLNEGQLVFVTLNKAMNGSSNATLKLGSNSAINLYLTSTTQLKAAYAAGSVLAFAYINSKLVMINPPAVV